MASLLISIPADEANGFRDHWKELRLADAISADQDLSDPVKIENFDGATLVQWVVEITPVLVPVITAALGYVVAARGELEYEKDGEKIRFKNLKPSRIKEVMTILDDRAKN